MKHPHNFGLKPQFKNIPEELREGHWCVWFAKPKANGKFDKIPSNGVAPISTAFPDNWLTFEEAEALYNTGRFNGVGRLAERDGLAFIDIDDTLELPEEIKELGATYNEKSPSGSGMRLVYTVDVIPNRDLAEPFEVYAGNSPRFLTITGNVIRKSPIAHKNGQVAKLVASFTTTNVEDDPFAGVIKPDFSVEQIKGFLDRIDPDAGHDTWIKVVQGIHHQFDGSDIGLNLLDEWSQRSVDYDKRELEHRYNSFDNYKSGAMITAATVKKFASESLDAEYEETIAAPEPVGHRFTYVEDFMGAFTAPKWIIKGMLEEDSLGMVYGASGAGKSYFTLDMASSISTGVEFHGHKTIEGQVVYMAGEGARGIKARLMAWFKEKNIKPNRNLIITNRITDFSSKEDMIATINELKQMGINPKLIIIDTLARASGSLDENSTQDMNVFIKACDGLRQAFKGASILPVHHTGKGDKNSARGSSVLRAAMDVEIQVDSADNGIVVTATKMKDGDPFETLGLAFKRINLGIKDEDGEELHSAILYKSEEILANKGENKLTPSGAKVVKSFDEMWEGNDNKVPAPPHFIQNFGMDSPTEGFWLSDVKEHFKSANSHITTEGLKSAFKRGMDDAIAKEHLAIWDDIVVKL